MTRGRPPRRQRKQLEREALYLALTFFLAPSREIRKLVVRVADETTPAPKFEMMRTQSGEESHGISLRGLRGGESAEHYLAQRMSGSHRNRNKGYAPQDTDFVGHSGWLLILLLNGKPPVAFAASHVLQREMAWSPVIIEKVLQLRRLARARLEMPSDDKGAMGGF